MKKRRKVTIAFALRAALVQNDRYLWVNERWLEHFFKKILANERTATLTREILIASGLYENKSDPTLLNNRWKVAPDALMPREPRSMNKFPKPRVLSLRTEAVLAQVLAVEAVLRLSGLNAAKECVRTIWPADVPQVSALEKEQNQESRVFPPMFAHGPEKEEEPCLLQS